MKTKKTVIVISAVGILLLGVGSYTLLRVTLTIQQSQMSNTPEIRGSQLKYKVLGSKTAVFFIEVEFEESYYDYEYTVDVGTETEGFLYMEPPPRRTKVITHITAISETGKRSEPLVFTNKEWWGKVTPFRNYTVEHVFTF